MALVLMFRARRDSHRFRANQKVWIERLEQDHLLVRFKWRGVGRYTRGVISRFGNTQVGPLREIDVDDDFARRHSLEDWDRPDTKQKKGME